MQKMEPGYDPEGGDWLYFYSSPAGGFTSGRLENCRSCHLRAKEKDFVYYVTNHESDHRPPVPPVSVPGLGAPGLGATH